MSNQPENLDFQHYPLVVDQLPKGWVLADIQSIALVIEPGFASGKQDQDDQGVPHLRPMNVDREGQVDLSVVKKVPPRIDKSLNKDDVLFNNTNSPELVGKTAIIGEAHGGFAFSNHMTRIKFGQGVAPRYMALFIHYLWQTGYTKHRCTNHVNQASISSSTLANTFPVLMPPEKEQIRIVEKLEELLSDLDDGVAELKAAQAKLTQYRQSLLKSAVEGSLTAEWRAKNKPDETGEQLLKRILTERRKRWEKQKLAEFREKGQTPPKDWQRKYPEPVAPETSELPELPEGWVWASLDQCTADAQGITDGPFGSNLKTAHYTKSGPRVIRLQNIGEGIFHDDKAHISETHYLELTKHSIESGDTVVAMMGEVLPRACTIPNGVAPGIVKADCARVRVNKSLIEPDLLPYFLNSEPVRERTKALVKGIGRPRINLSHIRAIAIPVAPKLEQIKMLELFRSYNSSVDAQLSEIDRSLSSTNAQRKNILKEAFEGRLVTQDPKDGTAAQLLHNIKINRDKFDKEPKPGRSKKGRVKGRQTMKKLEDVLAASKDWLKAEDAFKECGATDGTSTAVIEELYYELRALDKKKRLDVQRRGDSDWLRLKDGTNR